MSSSLDKLKALTSRLENKLEEKGKAIPSESSEVKTEKTDSAKTSIET